ncbi:hypothetical protein ML462_15355 [Gramella lutea]|uniref:Lipoprotein n=1 Tax=Christiangramia lutea TaxID=1607951 RepID=A0A9X1V7P9_9FLAO|nr:hypothetical protein [Christiangramia lutea]MCH4824549.1 hypothetical protein [Christiangramia lutea]
MNRIKFTIVVLLIGQFFFTSCGEKSDQSEKTVNSIEKKTIILDITKIINKTEQEVTSVLGNSEKNEIIKGYPCENEKCKRAFYKDGKIEIIFKNEKASRITINNISDLTNNDNALERIGLENKKPTFKNPENVIRWENINNISEISFFPDYILIKS